MQLVLPAAFIGATLGIATAPVEPAPHSPDITVTVDLDALRCFGRRVTNAGDMGPNLLLGTPGRDVIHGRAGADRIFALSGDDRVCGGRGRDVIDAGDGIDRVDGGRGKDDCTDETAEVKRRCE